GVKISDRSHPYNVYVAAFSDGPKHGQPAGSLCLITTSMAAQEGGFIGVAEVQVPVPPQMYKAGPATCLPEADLKSGRPVVGQIGARLRGDEHSPATAMGSLHIFGWNFRRDSRAKATVVPLAKELCTMPDNHPANEIVCPMIDGTQAQMLINK